MRYIDSLVVQFHTIHNYKIYSTKRLSIEFLNTGGMAARHIIVICVYEHPLFENHKYLCFIIPNICAMNV